MTAVMAQHSHVKQEAQVWEQGINRTLVSGIGAYWMAVTGRHKRLVNLMYQPAMLLS